MRGAWGRIFAGVLVCAATVASAPARAQEAASPVFAWPAEGGRLLRARRGEDGKFRVDAFLRGKFLKKDWNLLYRDQSVKVTPTGDFVVGTSVPAPGTYGVRLQAVSPFGDVVRETRELVITEQEFKAALLEAQGGGALSFSPGLSLSSIDYRQTGFSNYSAILLTGKLTITGTLVPDRWALIGNVFGTIVPVTKNQSASLRFIGANARLGYYTRWLPSPWRLGFWGGLYYTTTSVSGVSNPRYVFGFENLSGPQGLISLERTLASGNRVVTYAKFAAISDRFAVLSAANNEIALGGAFVRVKEGARPWSVNVDYANLSFKVGASTVKSSSISLGGSLYY